MEVSACTYFAILFVLVKYVSDNSKHFKLQILWLFPLLESSIQSLKWSLFFFKLDWKTKDLYVKKTTDKLGFS